LEKIFITGVSGYIGQKLLGNSGLFLYKYTTHETFMDFARAFKERRIKTG